MAGNLVIVESPAKAGTIQKFLGDGYTVKSSFGHVRDLPDKDESIDIAHGFEPEYEIPAAKRRVVEDLKRAAAGADIVWLASDEDREGEAISWHLSEVLGLDPARTRRIVFHEITRNAILHAIETPRSIDMDLVYAQQARRVLDRLVGYELSPLLWRKIQPRLSAGRVQSVALRLVVDREREIIAFRPEPYYRVEALFHPGNAPEGVLVRALLDRRFKTIEEARAFLESCIDAEFRVSAVEKKDGVRTPSAPFTTSTLQQEASRKLHMSVSRTMAVAQKLYESGLITYMRTDSTNLSSLAINTAKAYITDNYGADYSRVRQYHTTARGAQEAHEAIRPTYIERSGIQGSPEEQKLYELIWKRTVASQMADAKVSRTSISISNDRNDAIFTVQAQQVLFDGFLKVYMEGRDDEQADEDEVILPAVHEGDRMLRESITAECKFTQPQPRYSEATLVKKLEELGIGRPSTYAPTISTLTKSYITKGGKEGEKIPVQNLTLSSPASGSRISVSRKNECVGAEKGKLIPQEIGMRVTDYLVENFANILDYGFTASVEQEFDHIAAGQARWNDVIGEFYRPFKTEIDSALNASGYSRVERLLGNDPADGRPVIAKLGKFGPYIQKGEGEDRVFASMSAGQLIESITLEEALRLFSLPRTVGSYEGIDIIATKGRYGPYIKYGDRNISLPKGKSAETIDLDSCIALIGAAGQKGAEKQLIAEWGNLQLLNGSYGPYIKCDGRNYKLPKGCDASALSEEDCRRIVSEGQPTAARRGRRSPRR